MYYDPIDFPQDIKNKLYQISSEKSLMRDKIRMMEDPEKEERRSEDQWKKEKIQRKNKMQIQKKIKNETIEKFPDIEVASEIYKNWGIPSWITDPRTRKKKPNPYKKKIEKLLQESPFKNISDVKYYVLSARDFMKNKKIKYNLSS